MACVVPQRQIRVWGASASARWARVKMWQNVAKRGKTWQNVAKCGKMWQNVAKRGKTWQDVAKCGKMNMSSSYLSTEV
jgi:hypothetical protein